MTEIVILKTGALGDVLRTTSILPGLRQRYPDARVTWLTAHGAVDLVRTHPEVAEVVAVDPGDEAQVAEAGRELARRSWDRVLSFDDELPLCRVASQLGAPAEEGGGLSGAYLDGEGQRSYSRDTAAWFDMGLISAFGKREADRLKKLNARSHPAIYAEMLGLEMGEPALVLPAESLEQARCFAERHRLDGELELIGLNTGAGGRWESKKLSVERTVELAAQLSAALAAADRPEAAFLILGGPDEAERNAAILAGLQGRARAVDAGTGNGLLDFAALVDRLALLVTSDSLALHVAVARRVPVVAFFAPTSEAEIELYGRGEKVGSTAPDACTYRPDVDTSTLTVERLLGACRRTLGGPF